MYVYFEQVLKWFNRMFCEVILDAEGEEVLVMLADETGAVIAEIFKLLVDVVCLVFDDHPHDLAFLSEEVPLSVLEGKNSLFGDFLVFDEILDVVKLIDLMHGLDLHPLEMILNSRDEILLYRVYLILHLLPELLNLGLNLDLNHIMTTNCLWRELTRSP